MHPGLKSLAILHIAVLAIAVTGVTAGLPKPKEGLLPFVDQSLLYILADLPDDVIASGTYPSVVLLHGAAFTSKVWKETRTITALQRAGYRVLAIDLPGHGGTAALPYQDANFRAEVVQAAMQFVGGDLKALISPSMSGAYAIPFVERYGVNLTCWIAVAPAGISSWSGPPEFQMKHLRVLGVYGKSDPMLLDSIRFRNMFPTFSLRIMENASHACYKDEPEEFNSIIVEYLAAHMKHAPPPPPPGAQNHPAATTPT